jgi:hypothetical protein
MNQTSTCTEDDMTERLLALLLAGALVAPQLGRASESKLNNDGERQASVSEKLPLPRIPHLDTMPWINFGSELRGPRIDTLLLPDLNFSPVSKSSAFANSKVETPLGRDEN